METPVPEGLKKAHASLANVTLSEEPAGAMMAPIQ
jgi:hypothetical protein